MPGCRQQPPVSDIWSVSMGCCRLLIGRSPTVGCFHDNCIKEEFFRRFESGTSKWICMHQCIRVRLRKHLIYKVSSGEQPSSPAGFRIPPSPTRCQRSSSAACLIRLKESAAACAVRMRKRQSRPARGFTIYIPFLLRRISYEDHSQRE